MSDQSRSENITCEFRYAYRFEAAEGELGQRRRGQWRND
jgi:hypothetical protein